MVHYQLLPSDVLECRVSVGLALVISELCLDSGACMAWCYLNGRVGIVLHGPRLLVLGRALMKQIP